MMKNKTEIEGKLFWAKKALKTAFLPIKSTQPLSISLCLQKKNPLKYLKTTQAVIYHVTRWKPLIKSHNTQVIYQHPQPQRGTCISCINYAMIATFILTKKNYWAFPLNYRNCTSLRCLHLQWFILCATSSLSELFIVIPFFYSPQRDRASHSTQIKMAYRKKRQSLNNRMGKVIMSSSKIPAAEIIIIAGAAWMDKNF